MSLKSSIRYFYRGPGVVLVIVGVIIAAGWIIKQSRDRQEVEAAKHQKSRELGQVNPSSAVDASQAAKEALLSDRKLHPGFSSEPETKTVPIPNAPIVPRPTALPTLVSFYAQVQATPSPSPTPAPERKATQIWLPRGILIPAVLVNTVESSHINTPVLVEITRDIYQNGHLVIPAGTIASCFAQAGAVRDRIEVSGKWSLVFSDGKEFEINAIALDREADPSNQQFGIEDGSAGLQGDLVESDHWANAKAFIALLMTSVTQAGTAAVSGAISHGAGAGVGVGLPDTTPILSKYLDQLLNGETGDGRFVRVAAGKELYLFPTTVTEPQLRSIGARRQEAQEAKPVPLAPSNPTDAAVQMEKEILQSSEQPNQEKKDENRVHY